MSPGWAALVAAVLAGCAAGGGAALVVLAGPLDSPRPRGMHQSPTVTSGGLAVMAACGIGLPVFAWLAAPPGLGPAAACLGFAGALGLIGAVDDLIDFGAKGKLVAQAVMGLLFAAVVARIDVLPLGGGINLPLGPVIGALGTALWLVVATNSTNFMDGVDGLAAGSLAIVLAALAVAGFWRGEPAVGGMAAVGAAALIGFLPWNLPSKRLFQGDTGALFSGFLMASLAIAATPKVSLYFAPMAMTPFLTDVLLTLLIRARRRERLFEAHRDHLYQVWMRRNGGPHAALTLRVWAVMAAYALAALGTEAAPAQIRPWLFAAGVAVAAVAWRTARKTLEAGL